MFLKVFLDCIHNVGVLKTSVCFSTGVKNTEKFKMGELDHGTSFSGDRISGGGMYAIMLIVLSTVYETFCN